MTTTSTTNETTAPDQLTFEMNVREGDEVEVRWTNSFCYYRAIARVVRCNAKSFRVTVIRAHAKDVDGDGGAYLIGRTLAFPRCFDYRKWSVNNGCFFLPPAVTT